MQFALDKIYHDAGYSFFPETDANKKAASLLYLPDRLRKRSETGADAAFYVLMIRR